MFNRRSFEKNNKFGYIFPISYNGLAFDSFDEVSGKKSVKSTFKEIMNSLSFTWAKGIQQGGRTDAKVSAKENILYVSSSFSGDLDKVIREFNDKTNGQLVIKGYIKTLPNLEIPKLVVERRYIYSYPNNLVTVNKEEIEKRSKELSGRYDLSRFTDIKGSLLKEKVRKVEISPLFTEKTTDLYFNGESFLPKQVRIMSGFILTDTLKPLRGRFLSLVKVVFSKELKEHFIEEVRDIKVDGVLKVEKLKDIYIFNVSKKEKGKLIGPRGRNIKKLRKIYGDIIIKEVVGD